MVSQNPDEGCNEISKDETLNNKAETLNKFMYFRSEIKHEFDLISGRLNAFLSSQSFLILAYAAAMNNTHPKSIILFPLVFPIVTSIIGIILAYQAYVGIEGADKTVELWNGKINKLIACNSWLLSEYDSGRKVQGITQENGQTVTTVKDEIHRKSLSFARWSPPIFAIAWVCLFFLAIYLYCSTAFPK